MNKTITATVLAAGVALGAAAPSLAATAYMDGTLNVGPKWDTITGPNGEKCPKATCGEIRYNYFTHADAAAKAGAWMDANNTADSVIFAFSLGAVGTTDARALRPDWKGTIVNLGPPSKPLNGRSAANGGRPVLDVDGGKVEYVTAQGDGVTTKSGGINSTHLNGYSGRNFQTEPPISSVTYNGNVRDQVYTPRAPAAPAAATPKQTWAEKVAASKLARAERAEARKVAREERREESRAKWSAFVDKLRGDDETPSSDNAEASETSSSDSPSE